MDSRNGAAERGVVMSVTAKAREKTRRSHYCRDNNSYYNKSTIDQCIISTYCYSLLLGYDMILGGRAGCPGGGGAEGLWGKAFNFQVSSKVYSSVFTPYTLGHTHSLSVRK